MKPFLIDVPVLLFAFIRPDTLSEVFKVIKEAKPSKLYIVSDGPRENNSTDRKKIEECREIVQNIDWECEVHRLYFDENQGMYITFKRAMDYVFEREDRCIFLEDDVVTSVSFFRYCEELLEKYKDDLRISMISGMNHIGVYNESNSDYFFTRGASIWGFAFWKRTYKLFYDFGYGKDSYTIKRIQENAKPYKEFQKSLKGYLEDENYNGHIAGPEFYFSFVFFSQNQLSIIPTKNMVCNIGFGEGNTHFGDNIRVLPRNVQKMFKMRVHEVEFPLKHPQYIIDDKYYEKKLAKLMGRPWHIKMLRVAETIVRHLIYGEYRALMKKAKKRFRKQTK